MWVVLGERERKGGPTVQVSVVETTKQNIFIHEFIQPKHASNPQELAVQNGSQAEERRRSVQRRKEPGFTAYHPVTISRVPGLTKLQASQGGSFLKAPGSQHLQPSVCPPSSSTGPWDRRRRGLSAQLLGADSLSRWV